MSKVTLTNINLTAIPGTKIYLDIDIFRFTKDIDLFEVEVGLECNGEYEQIEIINLDRSNDEIIINHNDLQRVAQNWIFKNVEITKEL